MPAHAHVERQPQAAATQYLTFAIAGEEYAVAILRVREILQFAALTVVPTMPDYVRGVLNLRGAVVPVIDLAAKFRKGPSTVGKLTCILIVEVLSDDALTPMGLLIDAFGQVVELRDEDIEPPPAFGTRIRAEFLLGMGKVGAKFALILDPDKVLSEDELLATGDAEDVAPENDPDEGAPSTDGRGQEPPLGAESRTEEPSS